ncbi:MAG TPA: response regulator transcription factor [Candidatus Anaerobutyricum stercoripullorum]|uniref:Stage 0 sporulation protein A homolog n=1 Tax=Candidatus Anaerobutyricum stercoripullorum TaxID=2838456 RepID=A0A9D1X2V0_9FIRM|nr:response regulator transcription factor [Candidatus Anaerobutyricum stercoripullorum]
MAVDAGRQYILIVEDDEDLAEGICLSLQSPELTFVRAGTIEEAEKQRKEQKFDLLILDINLPDGSGLDFCRQIREQSRVPIALLTARDMEIDIVSGLECGADDYITKPFSLMVLRARIRALLRRNVPEQKSEYRKGCFHFLFDRMEFYKEGRPVELSKTERRILQLLVFHEGQVITRDRLMEWVWPDGTEYVEDNALSVGIRRLRDKLEDAPSRPQYIRTVYGKGYVWESDGHNGGKR